MVVPRDAAVTYTPSTDRYDQMIYNRCGNSGLLLPAISLGLWHNFGGVDDEDTAQKLICQAFDLGITHFDLANNYGPPAGAAEELFGRVLRGPLAGYRDELVLSTKAGYRMWPGPYGEWGSRKYLLASLDQSLKRMGVEYVDIFYSHRFDPDTPLEETVIALASAVRQGKALYVGISSYMPEDTVRASEMLKQLGTPCVVHQPNYSMLDRWVEDMLLDVLGKHGIGCIAFCPLAEGLLTGRYLNGVPDDSRAAKPWGHLRAERITERLLCAMRQLNEMAQKREQTLAQMALAWLLRDARVTSVLIGASRVEQLQENVAALNNLEFSALELTEINKILSTI